MYFTIMIFVFILGYLGIALEHPLKVNKTASALLLAVVIWTVFALFGTDFCQKDLIGHLGETSEILFFLLGAMTIVEIIDKHNGFRIITDKITTKDKRRLLWVISFITFFLSPVLDNLASTIVMIALLRKLIEDREERWLFAGMVVLAANSGGAWSPIGDVTTIMLWIKGNVTTFKIIAHTFIPSLVSMLVPLIFISLTLKGEVSKPKLNAGDSSSPNITEKQSKIIFFLGVSSLLFVPIFKTITNLPPYFGILLGVGVMWLVTEIMHRNNKENYKKLNVATIMESVDVPSVLFFLGILMAVAALQSAGHLNLLAASLDKIGNIYVIDLLIGLLSSVVDNVPMVAAAMGMYPVATPEMVAASTDPNLHYFLQDGAFWEFLAYCAGTGGSILIIGSAAGVAAMGMEKIDFIWYLKKISIWALVGYFAGGGVYILLSKFIIHV